MGRSAEVTRKTKETEISCKLELDGTGAVQVSTGSGFFDHMLDLFGRHALFDLSVSCKGDLAVDLHHTVEDIGIVLGEAFRKATLDKHGIRRYGFASIPMDEALVEASVDISGRGRAELAGMVPDGAPISPSLLEGFLSAFASNAAITLHVDIRRGRDPHHVVEASFKALARALRAAIELDPRQKGLPTTKGLL